VIVAIAFAAGVVIALVGLPIAVMLLDHPPHVRRNFRGRDLIGTGGVVLGKALVGVWLVSLVSDDGGSVALAMMVAGLSMCVLGYVDDVYGDRRAGGLIGHARALLEGTFTTGMLKAAGGVVVGLGAAWIAGWRDAWVIAAGAVIALASNLANLFDLRPGRVIKVWIPVAVWLGLAIDLEAPQAVVAGLGGAVCVFVVWELRERVMLGDTGAGLLGAVLGAGAVAVLDRRGVVVCGVVLFALTLLSEAVSFSRVIEALPPLRWLDHVGRRLG
jgi:UDP-GlcNAc:undecaprenyl-phosphate GlcNAc-1-phosphate transferase